MKFYPGHNIIGALEIYLVTTLGSWQTCFAVNVYRHNCLTCEKIIEIIKLYFERHLWHFKGIPGLAADNVAVYLTTYTCTSFAYPSYISTLSEMAWINVKSIIISVLLNKSERAIWLVCFQTSNIRSWNNSVRCMLYRVLIRQIRALNIIWSCI